MGTLKLISLEGELKKNPDLKESDLQMLREWCEKQPHLPKVSNMDLILFLHSKYYSLEKTKKKIENYYTIRTHLPEFFTNRNIKESPELRISLDVSFGTPLKGKTREGYSVLYSSVLDSDASRFVHSDVAKNTLMIFDLWLQTQGTTLGHVIVFDAKKLSMAHVTRLSPLICKKFLYCIQYALPLRLKAVHFINSTTAMEMTMNIIKPFLKKTILEKLHIHTTLDSLDKLIPLEILPNEIGGKAGSLADFQKTIVEELEEFNDWFVQDERNRRVNESLRPVRAKSATELFGAEGSFKKLDID